MRTTIICDPAILESSQQMENRENRYTKRKRTDIDPAMNGSDFQQPVKAMRTYMGNLYNQQEHQYEFVNVMFDSNLLPVQNPIISEANQANLAEFSANWSTTDLLDLDQKTPSSTGTFQPQLSNFPAADSGHRHIKTAVNSEPNNQVNRTPSSSAPRSHASTKKIDEIIQEATAGIEDDDLNVAENVVVENPNRIQKKPPFTYTELIEYALEDRGELTVSGIYQWIS
uniref:Uncharacterized protein n=1 Tax=Lutzomyia longipalpis TaxID=7200 RepID=A0A1B0EZ58_LUTLO